MSCQLIPTTLEKVMQSRAYTAIILSAEEKQFAIYTTPQIGEHIQTYLTTTDYARPLTHSLVHTILEGFDTKLLQVVIHDLQDTIYFSRIFLEQQRGERKTILEIDARPSDSLTLALLYKAPLFCKRDVLEKAVPLVS